MQRLMASRGHRLLTLTVIAVIAIVVSAGSGVLFAGR